MPAMARCSIGPRNCRSKTGQPAKFRAGRPLDPRPRLVDEVVSQHAPATAKPSCDVPPGRGIAGLQRDATGTWAVQPEAGPRLVLAWAREVGQGKARLRLGRQAVIDNRPIRKALAAESLREEI